MSLASGARLGPYEIVSALGAGGMGEVYRARDTKLNRDVAIKVLPHDPLGRPPPGSTSAYIVSRTERRGTRCRPSSCRAWLQLRISIPFAGREELSQLSE